MCCAIKAVLKFVISTINVVLGIGFLLIALFGLLLRTSSGFVRLILDKATSVGGEISDEQAKYLTDFVLANSTGVSVILIIIGLALAALCFVGAFASCCGCGLLLKIYAVILGVLLVAQIIAVAVLFSNPAKLTEYIQKAMAELLQYYYVTGDKGKVANTIWQFAMTFNGTCCGMDGVADFKILDQARDPPASCCKTPGPKCDFNQAEQDKVDGCRKRIETFTYENLKIIMYVAIGAIVIQGALVIIVGLAICL